MARHGGTRRRSHRQSPGQSHRPVRLTEAQAQQRIVVFESKKKLGAWRRLVGVLRKLFLWRRKPVSPKHRPDERRPAGRMSDEAWIAKCKSRAERKARREHLQHVRRKNGKW